MRARDRRARAGRAVATSSPPPTACAEPALRPRVPDPEAVRSAPDREDRAGGRARRRWTRASRRGRSTTSTRIARSCTSFVYHSGLLMKPIFTAAKQAPKRIVFAEGEDERVLRAVQVVVDERLAQADPDRPAGGARAAHRAASACACKPGVDFEIDQPGVRRALSRLLDRPTTSMTRAQGRHRSSTRKIEMRRRHTLIGAMMIHKGEADGMICGTFGTHATAPALHRPGDRPARGRATLRGDERADAARRARCSSSTPTSTPIPTAEQLAEITLLAAEEMRRFGIAPKVALLSHSNFGTSDQPSAREDARRAGAAPRSARPSSRSTARCTATPRSIRRRAQAARFRTRALKGDANLLVMPTLDAANISFNLLKTAAGGGVDDRPDAARRAPSRCTS